MKYKNTIDLKRAHADLRRTALAIIQKLGDRIVAIAYELAPVDTGYYRASIHATPAVGGSGLTVFISAPYALYIEVGHVTANGSYVPPNPVLRRAIARALGEFPGIVAEYHLHAFVGTAHEVGII